MPVIIPVGFAQVNHFILDTNTTKTNSVSYGIDASAMAPISVADVSDLHDEFFSHWDSELDNSLSLTSTRVTVGNDGPALVVEYSPGAQPFLRNVGNAAAGANAAIISKRTAFGGRQFRGRIFLPGAIGEADVDEAGRLTPARVTALQALATSWRAALEVGPIGGSTITAPMVVLHGAPLSGGPAPLPTPVTSLLVRSIYGIVRRRRPRA